MYVTVAIRLEIYGFGNSEEAPMARKMQQSDGGIPKFADWMTTPTDKGGMGFEQGQNDLCLFFNPKTLMRIACHVDDIIISKR